MRRISIRGLMAVVLVSGVGLAALRNASDLWAGIMLLAALAVLGVAILGVMCLREWPRFWWTGFAVFEGGYLLLAFGPWFASEIEPRLATTLLLGYVHSQVTGSPVPRPEDARSLLEQRASLVSRISRIKNLVRDNASPSVTAIERQLANLDQKIYSVQGYYPVGSTAVEPPPASSSTGAPISVWLRLVPGAANHDQFQRVGHSLFALLAGALGAIVSTRFYLMRCRCLPATVPPETRPGNHRLDRLS
jgi:hypothetical protein